MKKINLFFLSKNNYACIVTTKDEISETYDRKVTLDLEQAKPWAEGKLVGNWGSADITGLEKFDDQNYYYIDTRKWLNNVNSPSYMAIHKELCDGKEHMTKDLQSSIGNYSCVSFLFPGEKVKHKNLEEWQRN